MIQTARYRSKDEIDLAWNAIRKIAEARLNVEFAIAKERRKNEILTQLWGEFEKSLARGEVMALEPEFETWVRDALSGIPIIEGFKADAPDPSA